MRARDLEFKLDKHLVEIIDNQKTVDELKSVYKQMRRDLGDECREYIGNPAILKKYDISIGGYLSSILGAYDEIKELHEQD